MKSRRLCLYSVPLVFIIIGILLIVFSNPLLKYIISTNIVLTSNSKVYDSWIEIPELIPMDFYFFNWTNPESLEDEHFKPKLEQLGPYRFMLDLQKVNVTWNDNGTVTYNQKKFWYFEPEESKGSLDDVVVTLNTPALGAAHLATSWNYMIRKTISYTLSSLYPTIYVNNTVDELLFSGYPDTLTKMSTSLPVFADSGLPKWDRFGWFYQRNGSSDVDGTYNIGTGEKSTFAKVYSWNYMTNLPFYDNACARVQGFTGDNFRVSEDKNSIWIFLPELCRALKLNYVGDMEVNGILGRKYVVDEKVLDNGTKIKENLCYGTTAPSGVFNMSGCQFGSPVFASLPHFYQADPYYLDLVEGLQPSEKEHEYSIVVEPNTGSPLEVKTRLQINLLLHPVPSISLYEYVPEVYFPIMWFDQRAGIPKKELSNFKLLLNIPTICKSIGGVMIVIAIATFIALPLIIRKKKPKKRIEKEEDVPLRAEWTKEKIQKM